MTRKGRPRAICLRCGQAKAGPWRKCPRCGLEVARDEELLVKSAYLSVHRYEEPEDGERYRDELAAAARAMEAGEAVVFDEAELARLREEKRLFESVRPAAAWKALLLYFLPVILFLVALWGLVFLVEHLVKRRPRSAHAGSPALIVSGS